METTKRAIARNGARVDCICSSCLGFEIRDPTTAEFAVDCGSATIVATSESKAQASCAEGFIFQEVSGRGGFCWQIQAAARCVLLDGQLAGNIGSWRQDGVRLVGYWIGKEHWGKGVATRALAAFLHLVTERPLHARRPR